MGRRRRPPAPGPRPSGAGEPPALAGHRVVGPVGFGADGAVWAAEDAAGRDVVISVLPLPTGSATIHRLAAMRHGTHSHLARIRQVVRLDEDRCAVVSDRIHGPTLATVVAARGALDDGELAGLLAGVGSALGHLHERGVIHGDVSPANIIVTPEGTVVLVDLAGQVARELGTPGFVPPERSRGAAAGAAGDVWALARVLEWAAGGHIGSRAARVLAPALAAAPADRPTARDLASGAAAIGQASPVRVPSPAALAQARMRDASAPTERRPSRRAAAVAHPVRASSGRTRPPGATSTDGQHARTSAGRRPAGPGPTAVHAVRARSAAAPPARRAPVPARHRGRGRGTVLVRWAPVWSVATGALLVAVIMAVVVPRVGDGEQAAPTDPAPDLVAVAELLARRDAALEARDAAALAATSVPGSPVAREDAAVLDRLTRAGTAVAGLRISATDLRALAADGPAAVVEVDLAQSVHERVTDGRRAAVAAQPARCARLGLAPDGDEGGWLLVRSEPCD